MKNYVDYDKRAKDCATFMRRVYPGVIHRRRINGKEQWIWVNLDNDIFAFDTEEEAASDICLEMLVTDDELIAARGKASQ